MKRPFGEILTFDFYFHQKKCESALCDVVRFCLKKGSSLTGEILVAQFDNAKLCRMTSVYSFANYEKVVNEQSLWQQFLDKNTRVLTVGMWNAIGENKKTPDIITFAGVSEDAPFEETNPVSIVTEGWVFSTPGYENERKKLAKRFYGRFVDACENLNPTYAAILIEDALACPHDLRKGKGTRCFVNFFISLETFGLNVITIIEEMYKDSFCQRTSNGLYVATWMFSPKMVTLNRNVIDERSCKVAKILADKLSFKSP